MRRLNLQNIFSMRNLFIFSRKKYIVNLKLHHIAETQNLRRVQVIAMCVADEGHLLTKRYYHAIGMPILFVV